MLSHFHIEGRVLDSIDLKTQLLTRGVKVHRHVYRLLSPTHRISPDPLDASAFFLPDGTVVHLIDLAFHLGHLKQILKPGFLSQLGSIRHMNTPFRLLVSGGKPVLYHKSHALSEVSFLPATDFYHRVTPSGLPYRGNAVLQGSSWLSFQCLWHCEYAAKGEACQFCHAGAQHRTLAKRGKPMPRVPSPEDVAHIVHHAVNTQLASAVQLTGGSTFQPGAEIGILTRYLDAIFAETPRDLFSGEILVYTTPPASPALTDLLFEHGAHRVAFSLEVWNPQLAARITPGKVAHTTRERHLAGLRHIAQKHGPNKACCNFIIGLEPVESLLEGARFMAQQGIVPVASVWIPFGMPVAGKSRAPELDYYQKAKYGLLEIYSKFAIDPPGGLGLNVCMCRDIAMHQAHLNQKGHPRGCFCGTCPDPQFEESPTPTQFPRLPDGPAVTLTVLGHGCHSCSRLENRTRRLAAFLGPRVSFEVKDDLETILSCGVGATPALLLNGRLLFWGRTPAENELHTLIQKALA